MSEQDQFSQNVRKTLFKERYFSGTHNYFFDVKVANNGSTYIVLDQRRKVGGKYVGIKMRIFEDEMLEFQRVLQKVIQRALSSETPLPNPIDEAQALQDNTDVTPDLTPVFFSKLTTTNNWQEFEEYTYYLLKLLGIQTAYNFLGDRQAGKADGFFKFGNLAVIYDCTLDKGDIGQNKKDQIINYCNRLKQGSIEISGQTTEEFYNHHKQVWIITQGTSRQIKLINTLEVKEIAIQDIMTIYQERLTTSMSNQALEFKLRNI